MKNRKFNGKGNNGKHFNCFHLSIILHLIKDKYVLGRSFVCESVCLSVCLSDSAHAVIDRQPSHDVEKFLYV